MKKSAGLLLFLVTARWWKKSVLFLPAAFIFINSRAFSIENVDSLLKTYSVKIKSDTSRASNVKQIITTYLYRDAVSDSLLPWIDTLRNIHGITENDNKLDAEIFQGKYFIRKAEYPKALERFYNTLQVAQRLKKERFVADAYLQIGIVFYSQKQFTDALDNFNNSLDRYEKLNDLYRESMLCYLVGSTQSDLNNIPEAEKYLDRAIELKIAIQDKKGEYESKIAKAKLLYLQKKYSAAHKLYTECLMYFKETRNLDAVTFISMGLSRTLMAQDSLPRAGLLLNSALHIADSLGLMNRKMLLLGQLKDYYAVTKDYASAFKAQENYYTIKDSIFNFDNAKTIAVLKANIEAEKKQAEIESLRHKERVARIQRIFGIAVIFFLLAYLYNLYKRFSFKKKAEETLAKTNKDLENIIVELKTAEHELIHAEKMASMGRLTSGIAHELRNPLNFVSNFSKLSEELVSEISSGLTEEDRKEAVRQLKNNLSLIQLHSNRADIIIRSMLQLSRKSSTERTPEHLNKLVEEFTRVAYKNFTDSYHSFKCNIQFNLDNRIHTVQMNSHEITGVILSLAHNAFDSMEEKMQEEPGYNPELRITTRLDNDRAFVYITDNGKGIPENMQQKIFEPFFSTKPIEKGTGMALSLCYDFMKVHQGGITANSNAQQTTLTFFLPVNSSAVSGKINYSPITNF